MHTLLGLIPAPLFILVYFGTCLYSCIHLHILTSLFVFHRDIDKVDDLMADITEQQEVAQEISDVISRPIGFGDEFDEVRTSLEIRNPTQIICHSSILHDSSEKIYVLLKDKVNK